MVWSSYKARPHIDSEESSIRVPCYRLYKTGAVGGVGCEQGGPADGTGSDVSSRTCRISFHCVCFPPSRLLVEWGHPGLNRSHAVTYLRFKSRVDHIADMGTPGFEPGSIALSVGYGVDQIIGSKTRGVFSSGHLLAEEDRTSVLQSQNACGPEHSEGGPQVTVRSKRSGIRWRRSGCRVTPCPRRTQPIPAHVLNSFPRRPEPI